MKKYIFVPILFFGFVINSYGQDYVPHDTPFIDKNLTEPRDIILRVHFFDLKERGFLDSLYRKFYRLQNLSRKYLWRDPLTKKVTAHLVRDYNTIFLVAPDTTFYCKLLSLVDNQVDEISFWYNPKDTAAVRFLYGSEPPPYMSVKRMILSIKNFVPGFESMESKKIKNK